MKTMQPEEPLPAASQHISLRDRAKLLGILGPEKAEGSVAPADAGPVADEEKLQTVPRRYLIAHSRQPQASPLNLAAIFPSGADIFNSQMEGIKVLRKLPPSQALDKLGVLYSVPQESQDIVVAELSEETAQLLNQQPALVVEPNLSLRLPQIPFPDPPTRHPSLLWPESTSFNTSILVLNSNAQPVPEAEVFVFGFGQTGGITDAQGRVQLSLFGESPNSITGLYVKPKSAYWDRWIRQPLLQAGAEFELRLRPLDEQFPGFPGQETLGWGYTAMKLDQLDSTQFNGEGVKVAIIDSGIAAIHPDLQGQVEQQASASLVGGRYDQDTISHGSHCAGVIAGLAGNGGIRGIAPRARLFIYKIFPGGEFDHLIDALDRCITENVDVVNLSLGADARSTFVEERLRAARNAGVACIVAAGNSSGPTQYPASSDQVFAVAAIGKTGQFPTDSYHSQQVFGTPDNTTGYFSAKFTCYGPEVDVCAPGVAILSSVPDRGYAAWDGTSMAGPHITGLAALILAHHPDFKSAPFSGRNAQRVDRLFQILRTSTNPLNLGSGRTGAGLPDALRALTAAPASVQDSSGSTSSNTGAESNDGSSLLDRARALGLL
jgi:subtilisin